MKQTAEYFWNKYANELEAAQDTMPGREWDCLEDLISDGMTEADFLDHVVSIEAGDEFRAKESK